MSDLDIEPEPIGRRLRPRRSVASASTTTPLSTSVQSAKSPSASNSSSNSSPGKKRTGKAEVQTAGTKAPTEHQDDDEVIDVDSDDDEAFEEDEEEEDEDEDSDDSSDIEFVPTEREKRERAREKAAKRAAANAAKSTPLKKPRIDHGPPGINGSPLRPVSTAHLPQGLLPATRDLISNKLGTSAPKNTIIRVPRNSTPNKPTVFWAQNRPGASGMTSSAGGSTTTPSNIVKFSVWPPSSAGQAMQNSVITAADGTILQGTPMLVPSTANRSQQLFFRTVNGQTTVHLPKTYLKPVTKPVTNGESSSSTPSAKDYIPPESGAHIITIHLKCPEPGCNLEWFNLRSSYNLHLRVKHDLMPYRCRINRCERAFEEESHLNAHIETHKEDTTAKYPCAQCPQIFENYIGLEKHCILFHEPGLYQCPYCTMTASIRFTIRSHMIKKHSYDCGLCKTKWPSANDLKAHQLEHREAIERSTSAAPASIPKVQFHPKMIPAKPILPKPSVPQALAKSILQLPTASSNSNSNKSATISTQQQPIIEEPLPELPADETNGDDSFCDPSALLDVKLKEEPDIDEDLQVIHYPAKKAGKRKAGTGDSVDEVQAAPISAASSSSSTSLLSNGATPTTTSSNSSTFVLLTQPNSNGQVLAVPINQLNQGQMPAGSAGKNFKVLVVSKGGNKSATTALATRIGSTATATATSSSGLGGPILSTSSSANGIRLRAIPGGSSSGPAQVIDLDGSDAEKDKEVTGAAPAEVEESDEHLIAEAPYIEPVTINCRIQKCSSGGMFPNRKALLEHMELAHCILPARCLSKGCGRSFAKSSALKAHLFFHKRDPSFTFKCSYCPEVYNNHEELFKHDMMVHEQGEYACTIEDCTFAAIYRVLIEKHRREDHPYICAVDGCRKAFKNLEQLGEHEKSYKNWRRYYCKWEGCTFVGLQKKTVEKHVLSAKHRVVGTHPKLQVDVVCGFHEETMKRGEEAEAMLEQAAGGKDKDQEVLMQNCSSSSSEAVEVQQQQAGEDQAEDGSAPKDVETAVVESTPAEEVIEDSAEVQPNPEDPEEPSGQPETESTAVEAILPPPDEPEPEPEEEAIQEPAAEPIVEDEQPNLDASPPSAELTPPIEDDDDYPQPGAPAPAPPAEEDEDEDAEDPPSDMETSLDHIEAENGPVANPLDSPETTNDGLTTDGDAK